MSNTRLEETDSRWSIWIDVEGFGAIYEKNSTKALLCLHNLMEALYCIGSSRVFLSDEKRLFIHQFGDGFVIVSCFSEESAERPIGIAIAVMRHLMAHDCVTKVAISAGDFADVSGCYPSNVRQACEPDKRSLRIGGGVMTIMPVMGSALIRAHKLAGKSSGAVLSLDKCKFASIPSNIILRFSEPPTIDWIHSDMPMAATIAQTASLVSPTSYQLEQHLRKYISRHKCNLRDDWLNGTYNCTGVTLHE